MSIRRRGKAFQVRLPGEQARSFPTRAAADKYELNRRLARSLGDLHEEAPITVDEMLDGYLHRWQVRSHPAEATAKSMRQAAAVWRAEFGDRLLSRLSVIDVDDVVTERAAEHPASAKRELELLKRALRDAQRRRQRFDLALLLIDPVKAVSRAGVALDLDELDRLASWFPEHLSLMPGILCPTRAAIVSGRIPEAAKDGGTLILKRYRHLFPDEMTAHLERYEAFVTARREGQAAVETGS
jgi:hypothetical protein